MSRRSDTVGFKPPRPPNPGAFGTWRQRAACIGKDLRLFFPGTGGRESAALLKAGRALCAACPVRQECAEAGRTELGLWGGHMHGERHHD